jgi:putative transposase
VTLETSLHLSSRVLCSRRTSASALSESSLDPPHTTTFLQSSSGNGGNRDFGPFRPKATEKVVKDSEELLAFFDFPAEHWIHLKTTNPIESTFATVRLRTKVTKGSGSRAAGLAMAYKLIESAQTRWRMVNAPHLVALVRAGVKFEKGVMVERSEEKNEEVAA